LYADDQDNGDEILSSSDNITFNFNLPTNQPNVATKEQIDTLIDFGDYTFWSDYSGVWNTASQLVITAIGVGSGNLPIGSILTIKASGNLRDIYNLFSNSTSSANLSGNWGLSSNLLVETIPLNYNSLRLWLDAADLDGDGYATGLYEYALSGNVISTWVDKSGGNTAYQTNSIKKPVYIPSALNGNAIVRFDGSDDFLNFPRVSSIRTAFLVVKERTASGRHFMLGDDTQYHFHRGDSNFIWHSTYTHDNIKNGNTYVDGTLVDGTITALPTTTTLISIVTTGNVQANTLINDRNIAGRVWDGDIAEVILYSEALSDLDRQTIEAYLQNKWGTP